jgi:hypothetical protein
MAKTIGLTVQVDDSQFQKFVRDYNAFAGQVKTLTVNFNAVTNTISRANQQSIQWSSTLRSVSNVLTGIVPAVGKVTVHFSKWAALIGGISMMLGTGAGLFGIDRLANTLIQRRRQIMGLGGDWGRIQAAQLGSMATISDPMSVMQRIQFAKMGDVLTRAGLQAAGVDMKDILDPKKGPAEIYEQVIRNMPRIFEQMQPGTALQFIQGRHLDRIMPIEDWMRFITPEGGFNKPEQERVLRGIEERKNRPGLTPDEGRSWADLYEAAKAFVMDIQTRLGSALSGIATSLTGVSKGFTDLLDALLDSPAVKRALEQVKTWLDSFAEYLKGDEAKKKLEEWTKDMENIPWAKLGETIGSFIEHLGTVIRVLLALKGATTGAMVGGAIGGVPGAIVGGAIGGATGYFSPDIAKWLFEHGIMGQPTSGQAPLSPDEPGIGRAERERRIRAKREQERRAVLAPQVPGTPPLAPGTPGWTPGAGWVPPTFPVNPFDPNATVPPAATGAQKQSAVIGGTNVASNISRGNTSLARFNFPGGNTSLASLNLSRGGPSLAFAGGTGGSLSIGGGGRSSAVVQGGSVNASWRNAARSAVPSNVGGGWASMMASNNNNFGGGGGGGRRGKSGPLDIDNWQLNRTAQLRIDNIAGANIYSTGVAMG